MRSITEAVALQQIPERPLPAREPAIPESSISSFLDLNKLFLRSVNLIADDGEVTLIGKLE